MGWTTRLTQNFNGETTSAAPSGWAYFPQAANYEDEVYIAVPGTFRVEAPGLSGTAKGAYLRNDSYLWVHESVSRGFTIDSYDSDLKASFRWQCFHGSHAWETHANVEFAIATSSDDVIANITWFNVDGYTPPGPEWTTSGFGCNSLDPLTNMPQTILVSGDWDWASDPYRIEDTQEFSCVLNLDLIKGTYSVQIDSTLYDNSGAGYPFMNSGLPAKILVTTDGGLGSLDTVFDEVKIETSSGPGGGLEAWAEPEHPTGNNGWYKYRPYIYVSCSGATSDYWKSVGTLTDKTAYSALSSGVASGEPSFMYTSGQVAGWNSSSGAYLYYGLTSAGADMSKFPVKWTDDVPLPGTLTMTTSSGSSIFGGFAAKSGYLNLSGFRGHTSAMTAPQEHFGVSGIDIYSGGEPLIHVDIIGGSPPITSTPSGQVYYANRKSLIPTTIPCSWSASPSGEASDLDHYLFNIVIPYDSGDLTADTGSLFAEITSEAGLTSRTSSVSYSKVTDPPVIDRLVSTRTSSSGSGEKRIIGHVNHTIPVARVEYTVDRRVPVLAVTLSGGSLATADGDYPFEYTSGLSFSSGPFTDETAACNKSVGIFGKPSSYLSYAVDDFPFYEGSLSTYFKPVWGAPSSTSGWAASGGVKTLFSVQNNKTGYANSISGDLYFDKSTSGVEMRLIVFSMDGTSAQVSLDLSPWGLSGVVDTWNYYRFYWRLKEADCADLSVQFNYSSSEINYINLPFEMDSKYGYLSYAVSGQSSSTSSYYPLAIGDTASGSSPLYSAKGYFSDIKLCDVLNTDPGGDWFDFPKSYFGGWTTSGVSFTPGSNNFEITVPGSETDDCVRVVKVRAVDMAGNRMESPFFNTSSCRPVLLRGMRIGTLGPEGSYSVPVNRFRLIDSQGQFNDMEFEINPTSYSDKADERIADNLSISGRRELLLAPKPEESVSFQWDRVHRDFMLDIKERADSGNSFFLLDHNDKAIYGKISVESFEEIVATVPSEYRISADFIGQGED
jgi:hypothetical protein